MNTDPVKLTRNVCDKEPIPCLDILEGCLQEITQERRMSEDLVHHVSRKRKMEATFYRQDLGLCCKISRH